jgi:hypothetical protein
MTKFGWCCTGHHEHCKYGYIDWNQKEYVCDCECHGGDAPATNTVAIKKAKAELEAKILEETKDLVEEVPVKKTRAPRKAKA